MTVVGTEFVLAAVVHHHAKATFQHDRDMWRLAAVGAGVRLEVLRPASPGGPKVTRVAVTPSSLAGLLVDPAMRVGLDAAEVGLLRRGDDYLSTPRSSGITYAST
jgi:hypothetical protein